MADLPKSSNVFDFLQEATKEQSKLRLAVSGPSGSGKTFSLINIAVEMGAEKICVIDTEFGSAAKYSNEFKRKFTVLDNRFWQSNYDPRRLIAVLKEIGEKFDFIIVDSLTHFWMGPGGFLALVDTIAKRNSAKNGKFDSFSAWKEADPIYNELIQTILGLPCHFGAALRAKSEYEDQVGANGKNKKVKVGMASQMRDGFEYEFDVEGMMDMSHNFIVGKTRCRAIDGEIINCPGANIAKPLVAWLTDGVEPAKFVPVPLEEAAPATVPDPAPKADLVIAFIAKIEAATTVGDLNALGKEITTAMKEQQVTSTDYNGTLSPAFATKKRALKVAA